MDFAILSRPLNLNKLGRGKVLEQTLNSMSTIVKSESGKPLTGFVVENLGSNTLRIRVSGEQGKEPVVQNGFDNFISGLKSFDKAEEDVYGIESALEEKRNPSNMLEFIIQNVGKNAPKFKLKQVNLIESLKTNKLKAALGLDKENLNIGTITNIYSTVQKPIAVKPLNKKAKGVKNLLKYVIERLQSVNLNPKEQQLPMVAKLDGSN